MSVLLGGMAHAVKDASTITYTQIEKEVKVEKMKRKMLDDVEAAMDLCEECMCNHAFYECERCGKQLCEDCACFNPDEDDSEEEPIVYCEDCYRELFEHEESEEVEK